MSGPAPNKLLIASTRTRAEEIARSLELDRETWLVEGFGGALTGHCVDVIVMIDPVPAHFSEWYDAVVRTRLWPSGHIINVWHAAIQRMQRDLHDANA